MSYGYYEQINSPKITWIYPYLNLIEPKIPLNTKTVLEIGVGKGYMARILRSIRDIEIMDGIEIWKPYYDFALATDDYNNLVLGDATKVNYYETFHHIPYDLILIMEFIEHLNFDDAKSFLEKVKFLGKTIIITCPNGFLIQGNFDGNPYQQHKSGFTKIDLKKLGFRPYGAGNLKYIPINSSLLQKYFPQYHKYLISVKKSR